MRTTASLDDHLLAGAKERAHQRGQTLGQLLEDALRRELAAPNQPAGPEIPVFSGGGEVRPGVDLSSNRSIREALDRDVPLEDLK
ncbi:MAG: antitoxin [Solirubrobacterales bacterium]